MKELVEEAVRDVDLQPAEIPSIDLYLDQITSLTSGKLKEGSERFQDRFLTKTMINNYTKDGVISPVKGKKYSREQLLQMLLVCSLKSTLSIGEIRRMLQGYSLLSEDSGERLDRTYARFVELRQMERNEAWDLVRLYMKAGELDPEDDEDFFTLLLGLSSMSAYLKNTVQILLEERFPPQPEPEEENQEEKAGKKEKKAQKKAKKKEKQKAKKKDESQ